MALCGAALALACMLLFNPGILQPQNTPVIPESSLSPDADGQSSLAVFLAGLKAGLLTFGGAYTVIPFIQQDAVIHNGWLSNRRFLDGIAL